MAITSLDILIEEDLQVEDGDLKIGEADNFNVEYIIYAFKGQFYKHPLLGVGIVDFINSPDDDARVLRKEIKKELSKDGYDLEQIQGVVNEDLSTTIEVKAIKRRSTI